MLKLTTPLQNRYELTQEISPKGRPYASRRTFLARDLHTKEDAVIKIIQPGLDTNTVSEDWITTKLFEREAQILASLNHPSIPQYKDTFAAEIEGHQSLVLVQAYVKATSLAELIQSGKRFSFAEVKTIAEHILQVLIYLHGQSPPVVHRDIKPSNILVGQLCEGELSQSSVYLIDFGAVHTDLTKESGTITTVGSCGYISLEQFSGYATPASDLYSLGMTLIYLVTGIHPVDLDYVDGKVQLPYHSLDPSFVQWLERMSAPYLDQRFDSAQQALFSLQSQHDSQGYCQHLKPAETKIKIERSRDRIRILIEKPNSKLIQIFMVSAVLLLSYFAFLARSSSLPIILLYLSAFLSLNHIKKKIQQHGHRLLPIEQRIIEIDRTHGVRIGSRGNRRMAIKWRSETSRCEDIDLVAYKPSYSHQFAPFVVENNRIDQNSDRIYAELAVQAGSARYVIAHSIRDSQLSPAEFWWLGQEISNFLGLDLQVIYPMPMLTAHDLNKANTCGCGC